MAKTFRQMVREARGQIKVISPQEAKRIIDLGAVMLIDVREAWEIAQHGTIPGARNITRGELEIKADTELPRRDPALADRAQKIFLTCGAGGKSTFVREGTRGDGLHGRLGHRRRLPRVERSRLRRGRAARAVNHAASIRTAWLHCRMPPCNLVKSLFGLVVQPG